MPCQQCGRTALFLYGPDGQQFPLCLDCGIKFENMQLQKSESIRRQQNYLLGEFEALMGLQGHYPRYELLSPVPVVNTGDIMLNHFNITNSQVGVVNTGSIAKVDASITVLKQRGDDEFADTVQKLTAALIEDKDLGDDEKSVVLQMLDAVSAEAVAPPENRRKAVVKVLLEQIQAGVKSAAPYVSLVGNLLAAANILFGLSG